MFRLLSIVLVLLGLGALGYGGMRLLSQEYGEPPMVSASAPAPEVGLPDPVTSAPVAEPVLVEPEPEPINAAPQPSIIEPSKELIDAAPSTKDVGDAPLGKGGGDETFEEADTAADALPGRGNIVESVAQITPSVQATLSGEQFSIEPVTPLVQRVSPMTENVWRWKVTPLEAGGHDLVIELFALIGDEALPVRTFRDKVEVDVSRVGQAIAFAQSVSPVAMVLGGIGSLLAGLFGVARFFRGR